ncbi:MAG: hypothetical protein KGZ75_07070 [Syntrophomonadaceae bacterium]|nr:hypothetical protein [Syntrophomonadaceae bacterium]
MDNEKFQELVLQQLTSLTEGQARLLERQSTLEEGQARLLERQSSLEEGQARLLEKQSSLEEGQARLFEKQSSLEEGQARLSEGQVRIEKRLNAVYEQTAMLTEFRTETIAKLTEISNTIDFLLHKGYLAEKEIFVLKKDISLAKK